jgi:hypothetical protein
VCIYFWCICPVFSSLRKLKWCRKDSLLGFLTGWNLRSVPERSSSRRKSRDSPPRWLCLFFIFQRWNQVPGIARGFSGRLTGSSCHFD